MQPKMTYVGGHIANLALHRLNVTRTNQPTAKAITEAVLYAACDIPELATNLELDEAVLRIQHAIRKTNETYK